MDCLYFVELNGVYIRRFKRLNYAIRFCNELMHGDKLIKGRKLSSKNDSLNLIYPDNDIVRFL